MKMDFNNQDCLISFTKMIIKMCDTYIRMLQKAKSNHKNPSNNQNNNLIN